MFDREKAIATIEADRCPCPGCPGTITEAKLSARGWRHCRICVNGFKVARRQRLGPSKDKVRGRSFAVGDPRINQTGKAYPHLQVTA